MDIEYVRSQVQAIKDVSEDGESAHAKEDRLWEEVLLAIAVGDANPAGLAAEALKTQDIDFSRWYA